MPDQTPIIVKRIKKYPAAHHGGSWKVAFADFMTAMMAFFLVMWILGLDEDTKSAIAGYFRDPMNFMKKAEGNKLESLLPASANQNEAKGIGQRSAKEQDEERKMLEQIKEAFEKEVEQSPDLKELKKAYEIKMTDEGLMMDFLDGVGSVFFESGSDEVRPRAKELFQLLAKVLKRTNPNLVLDGHTDSKPFGSGPTGNWKLSHDRAQSVYSVLVGFGLQDKRFLAIRGNADRKLRVKDDPLSYQNRRVTVLLPFKSKEKSVVGISGAGGTEAEIVKGIDIRSQ